MNKIVKVNFRGAELYSFQTNELVFVALKPIVEAMGLSWQGQHDRVRRDPVLKEGIRIIRIPLGRGGSQNTLCLKLELLNGWLFKIETNRIKDIAIRDRVQVYQRECYSVLFRRFFGPRQELSGQERMSVNVRRGIVTETRLTFGIRPAVQMWKHLGLPRVPAMEEALAQGDLFDKRAA